MIVDGGELVITFQLLPFNGQFSIKKMKVAVVKYNAGNIRSVDYALKRLGVEAVITADEAVLRAPIRLSFPVWERRKPLWTFCVPVVWIG